MNTYRNRENKSKQTALLMNIKINNKVQFIKSSSKLNLLKKFEIIAKKLKIKKHTFNFQVKSL